MIDFIEHFWKNILYANITQGMCVCVCVCVLFTFKQVKIDKIILSGLVKMYQIPSLALIDLG